ncbi:patatin-like phospholipase family protein [Paracoccus sp. MC1862]|nr:patatin-like phospholipase family protein [Paracoccus sp. MC1854]MBB1499647.1 patatin-like phospholipase family protein [Paracoccus sp. MC1862]
MLLALTEAGLRPDFVLGSSVGALNAAYFAGAPLLADVERLARIWCGLRRSDIFPLSPSGLLGSLRQSGSIVDPAHLRHVLKAYLPFLRIKGGPAAVACHGDRSARRERAAFRRAGSGGNPRRFSHARNISAGHHRWPPADGRSDRREHAAACYRRAGRRADHRASHRLCLRPDRAAMRRDRTDAACRDAADRLATATRD